MKPVAWALILVLGFVGRAMLADERPNILFIMSDDHACNAISAYGGRLAKVAPTPNIDRIATEGMRLDKCYVTNSICTPSRAVILSGQHSHLNSVRTLADARTPPAGSGAAAGPADSSLTLLFSSATCIWDCGDGNT